jgi:hypothetical protein
MTWPEARALAKAGVAVQMDSWPLTKTLIYSDGGSVRAVAMLVNNGAMTVVKNSDFGQTEIAAQNWRRA